jgi:glucose-1-phosphate cytidylyltransferase
MKVVLLAGGLGTRMREETEFRPKPMVKIGEQPILWHIMRNFSKFSLHDFVICTGYRGDIIRQYFRDFESINMDFTVKIGYPNEMTTHGRLDEEGWTVTVANTGANTFTGGRLFAVREHLQDKTFVCTYGDGLADVDIAELIKFHKSHGKIATLTTVRPTSRFGVLEIESDGSVNSFKEKPQTDGWVNAGYFVFEPEIFKYLESNSVLEREPLSQLARDNQLMAFRHEGFWQPIDTYREILLMNEMWESQSAPWKNW